MEPKIFQAIFIMSWALFLDMVVVRNWFIRFVIEEFIKLDITIPLRATPDPGSFKRLIMFISFYYLIMTGSALNLFGDYSISIAAIMTCIVALFMLFIIIFILSWPKLSKEFKEELKKELEKDT